ncbi:hypothetical protein EMIHUDRAFT_204378 [Emiliania huxleyi CCMP1516]|uniref:WD repeat-containing protein 60 n=2 Tax=Emiliania huxleyi TaxID=2903 RepID=A0A0D3JYA7_EMIH1|nr:hypothetical protein EMIHUDRAFT_204378 [Emiliania huxleyi CCMP1516]EOD28492.1 hypothetical protein EMIHUDRAFT_204378 [Emiliania huxleyi CCMP1516]|eukprot:XP_005780921.1 hypothetical protein EMIHUDRAFT_204378 [Emiliania huxleyi CCMP1516]
MADDEYDDDDHATCTEFEEDEEEEGPAPPSPQRTPTAAAATVKPESTRAPLSPHEHHQVVGQVDAIPRKPHFIAPQTQAERSLHSLRVARREALRKAVELQQESFTLYESAPQTPYELMRREIKLRTKSSQTRDDDSGAATQTEEIERDDQACHAPDDLATTARRALQDQSDSARTAATLSANTARLNRFLGAASAVVEALCVENALAGALGDGGLCPHSELPMASRSAELVPPSPFDGRPPVDISFAPGAGGVLVAYGPHPGDKPRGKRREEVALRRAAAGGILCVWSVHQPAEPREVLRCAGLPTCCAIASAPCRVALAGTAEGAVQLWDLRDSEARYERATLGGAMRALRSAAFSSHGCALNEGHEAPVVALALAPPTAAAEAEDLVATSLDSAGRLLVWQLLEGSLTQLGERLSEEGLPREGDGLNLDAFAYGQTVGARLRLVRTSAVHVCAPPARAVAAVLPATALCLALLPLDPSRCLVGLDNGRLVQVSRYANARPSPAEFAPPPDSSRARAVTCLAFSPSLCSAFLAGRADGSVSLYTLSASLPLLVLEPPALAPAVQLLCCVFLLLDGDATLHFYDLLERRWAPTASAPLYSHAKSGFGTAGCDAQVRLALGARVEARRSGGACCYLGVVGGGGAAAVHLLEEAQAVPRPNEAYRLHEVVDGL